MRRYKILFIDDEEIIRESFLKLVDWKSHQFDVAGVYKNGEAAWEYLTEQAVDIIVTDINMPFMNGIDLLENIRRECPRTRVILLTGYEYFEYAQKAVELKAFDFLLKPVTTKRLLGAVERAALDIEKEEAVEEAVFKGMELAQGHLMNQFLNGKIEISSLKEQAAEIDFPIKADSYLVLIAVVDAAKGYSLMDDEIGDVKRVVQEKIKQGKIQMEEDAASEFVQYFAENSSPYIPLLLTANKKKLFTKDFIRQYAERIIDQNIESRDYQLTLAVGTVRDNMEEVPESFANVMRILKKRHVLGAGRIIYASDSMPERKAADKIVLPTDTLLQHIRMGMIQEVQDDIRNIYEKFRYKDYISLESAKMVTTELAITAFKGEVASKDESVSYLYYLNHIQHLHTLDEMEHEITEFAVQVAEKRKNGSNYKKKLAEQALDFLKSHYANEELCLNDVAGFLNISVPYIGVLFKQETGRNFSAHLLEFRMEKAKELLRTTSQTISEISEKVGYSSSQYFAVCFKKYAGVAPGIYREQG